MRLKSLLFVFVALVISNFAAAQTVQNPTVTAAIHQKYDHTPTYPGFDTVVSPSNPTITLSSSTFVPVGYFNGYYDVEQIPYSPVDSSFQAGEVALMSSYDDKFSAAYAIGFPFYFFGIEKDTFVIGGNGLVTFNAAAANQMCFYNYTNANNNSIPWGSDVSLGYGDVTDYHRDAINGVLEDLDAGQGYNPYYYSIVGTYPNRRVIVNFYNIPRYPYSTNPNNRTTSQIVCYEASNIVEVHVKKRSLSSMNTGWGAYGIVGIQNATGEAQENGAPAAFWPEGYNPTTQAFDNTSFRFTPQGETQATSRWYRLMDEGGEPELVGEEQSVSVSPTVDSRYVHEFSYMDQSGTLNSLYDTVSIGYITNPIDDDTVGVNDVQTVVDVKMYAADGQIVVEGSDGMAVTLYDVNGRLLATRNDGLSMQRFDVSVSGAYLVQVGKYPARRVIVVK